MDAAALRLPRFQRALDPLGSPHKEGAVSSQSLGMRRYRGDNAGRSRPYSGNRGPDARRRGGGGVGGRVGGLGGVIPKLWKAGGGVLRSIGLILPRAPRPISSRIASCGRIGSGLRILSPSRAAVSTRSTNSLRGQDYVLLLSDAEGGICRISGRCRAKGSSAPERVVFRGRNGPRSGPEPARWAPASRRARR